MKVRIDLKIQKLITNNPFLLIGLHINISLPCAICFIHIIWYPTQTSPFSLDRARISLCPKIVSDFLLFPEWYLTSFVFLYLILYYFLNSSLFLYNFPFIPKFLSSRQIFRILISFCTIPLYHRPFSLYISSFYYQFLSAIIKLYMMMTIFYLTHYNPSSVLSDTLPDIQRFFFSSFTRYHLFSSSSFSSPSSNQVNSLLLCIWIFLSSTSDCSDICAVQMSSNPSVSVRVPYSSTPPVKRKSGNKGDLI